MGVAAHCNAGIGDPRGYDKSDEALLVKKLTEWNATPEQIQTILERFKK